MRLRDFDICLMIVNPSLILFGKIAQENRQPNDKIFTEEKDNESSGERRGEKGSGNTQA
jgi:hypothetical protein